MTYVLSKAVAYAVSQVGVHEIPMGSNCNPYSDWQYGVRCPGGGWCISFASRCTFEGGFQFDGATHGSRGFSFTGAAEAWARARGLWRDKHWRAQPGDWWIFNWDGGETDHGEVVHTDDGTMAVLIGGNTSNAVKFRKRDRHYLVGIVAFSQSSQAGPPPPPPSLLERTMIVQTHHYDADGKNPRPIPLKDANGEFVPATIIPALDGKSLELDKGASLRNDAPDGNRRKYVPNDLGGAKIIAIAPWTPSDGSTPGGVLRYSDGRPHFVRFS